jgi:hypothetical protein
VPTEPGRIFRDAWVAGVRKHYPDEPKPGYVAPWEDTPDWERASAAAVYEQVRSFVGLSDGHTAKLSREQKGPSSPCAGSPRSTSTSPIPSPATWRTGTTCRSGSRRPTLTFSSGLSS